MLLGSGKGLFRSKQYVHERPHCPNPCLHKVAAVAASLPGFLKNGMLDSFAAIKAAHFGNQFYLSCSWFRFGYSTFTGPDGPEYKLCMLRRPKKYFEVE